MTRGVCCGHYSIMKKAVATKQRTWDKLEKYGMIAPKVRFVKQELFEEMLKKKSR
jgi:hypothetical protein